MPARRALVVGKDLTDPAAGASETFQAKKWPLVQPDFGRSRPPVQRHSQRDRKLHGIVAPERARRRLGGTVAGNLRRGTAAPISAIQMLAVSGRQDAALAPWI